MDSLINRLVTGISVTVLLALSGAAHSLTLNPTTVTSISGSGTYTVGTKSFPWQKYDCLSCMPSGIDTIFVSPDTTPPNPNLGEAGVRAITGDATLTLSYKDDNGSEEGPFAGSYSTTFMNTSSDPKDATIVYGSGAIIDGAKWLEVKDGNQDPFTYLFDITGLWNGTDTITLNNFWPDQGAISHVAIWGGEPTSMVEPGTFMLFGMGLICVGLRRRLTN
jgi:hypothetical protein